MTSLYRNSIKSFLVCLVIPLLMACNKDNNTLVLSKGDNKQTISKNELEQESTLVIDTSTFSKETLPGIVRDKIDSQLRFVRNLKSDFPLKIKHYYAQSDQKIYCSVYQWDRYQSTLTTPELQQALALDLERRHLYDKLFDEIGIDIINQFGDPNKGHGDLRKEKFKMLDIWSRKLIWDLDQEYIELNMNWVPKKGYYIFKVFVVHYHK